MTKRGYISERVDLGWYGGGNYSDDSHASRGSENIINEIKIVYVGNRREYVSGKSNGDNDDETRD